MNNYIMKTISVNGTEVDFLTALRDFFISNSVMPFTLDSENLTNTDGEANFITLVNDDYKLNFLSPASDDSTAASITITLSKNNESETIIGKYSITCCTTTTTREGFSSRICPLFIVKGDNIDFIGLGNNNSSYGKGSGFYYIKSSTSEVGAISATSASTVNGFSFTDYETNAVSYTLAPYHTTSTSVDTLIMDSELGIKSKSTNYYCGTMLDCYGLGGGAKGTFYKDSNGTLLYCFDTNCCFKLVNKVE